MPGTTPVRIVVMDGSVHGAFAYARVKRAPRCIHFRVFGIALFEPPRRSARSVSTQMIRMFGRGSVAGTRITGSSQRASRFVSNDSTSARESFAIDTSVSNVTPPSISFAEITFPAWRIVIFAYAPATNENRNTAFCALTCGRQLNARSETAVALRFLLVAVEHTVQWSAKRRATASCGEASTPR